MHEKDDMNKKYESLCDDIKTRMAENEKDCMNHINRLKENFAEQKANGCAEYANLLVSLYNH